MRKIKMGFYRVLSEDELMHHGILGMKWGKKNGPPYPLSSSAHSSSEKKAGWRKSLSANGSGSKQKKSRLQKAAKAQRKDADDLRKHGYIKEADAVQKVADKTASKAIRNSIDSVAKSELKNNAGVFTPAQRIARKVDLDMPNDSVKRIIDHGQKATDLNNEMIESAEKEARSAMQLESFKSDLGSRLEKEFGVGVDDKEYFEMIRDEIGWDLIREQKYSPKTTELQKAFEKEIDEFVKESKQLTDGVVGDYGDSKIKDLDVSYRDVVSAYVRNKTDSSWVSYLSRHGTEIAYDFSLDFSDAYTFDEYNKEHNKGGK